jgi:hypothetical protein
MPIPFGQFGHEISPPYVPWERAETPVTFETSAGRVDADGWAAAACGAAGCAGAGLIGVGRAWLVATAGTAIAQATAIPMTRWARERT